MSALIWNKPPKLQWLAAPPSGSTTCNPACGSSTDVKPYLYRVGPGDNGEFYIAQRFLPGVLASEGPCAGGGWGMLVAVNVPPKQAYRKAGSGMPCQFDLNQGDLIKIPASWPDPVGIGAERLVCENGQPYPGCGGGGGTVKSGLGAGGILAAVLVVGTIAYYALKKGG